MSIGHIGRFLTILQVKLKPKNQETRYHCQLSATQCRNALDTPSPLGLLFLPW